MNPQERFCKRPVVTTDGCVNASDVIPSRRDVFDLGVVGSRKRALLPDLAISDHQIGSDRALATCGKFAIDARSTTSLGLRRSAPDGTRHRVLLDDLSYADVRLGNGGVDQNAGSGMRPKFLVPVSVTAIKSSIPQ
jgi:hypothetical protein